MNKLTTGLFAGLIAIGGLAGCQSTDETNTDVDLGADTTITVIEDTTTFDLGAEADTAAAATGNALDAAGDAIQDGAAATGAAIQDGAAAVGDAVTPDTTTAN